MEERILHLLQESIDVKSRSIGGQIDRLVTGTEMLVTCFASGHKILLFGNGPGAAQARQLAAGFVNQFQLERPPLAAIALTTDIVAPAGTGNDGRPEAIFARQIRALGKKDDIAWGISADGDAPDIVAALEAAREMGLSTIAMTGQDGRMADVADLVFSVDSASSARIQETHLTIGHFLCELVDHYLFGD